MLLTKMLTWWNSFVRATTPDAYDALFQMQQEAAESQQRRLKIIRHTLREISPPLCTLFEQAWSSADLAQCPDFSTWTLRLWEVQEQQRTW